MEEFLKQNYLLITITNEFLAAITGLFLYRNYKFTSAKYFIWFLLYVALGELFGTYAYYIGDFEFLFFLKGTRFSYNYWWFNIFWETGAVVFYAFYFCEILKTKLYKNVVMYSGFGFLIISLVQILSNLDLFFTGYFISITVLGAVVIFICSVLYFIEILQSDKILTFYKLLNFYISATIFIWWLITTPLVFFDIYKYNTDWNFTFLKWQIYLFSNLFMYLTFTFALIWCKPQKH